MTSNDVVTVLRAIIEAMRFSRAVVFIANPSMHSGFGLDILDTQLGVRPAPCCRRERRENI
jgi:hypothetical protein